MMNQNMPFYPTPFYQQNSNNQYYGPLQGAPLDTQNQPFVGMNCAQAPQAQSNTFQLYGMQHFPMGYLSGNPMNLYQNRTRDPVWGPTIQTQTVSQGAPGDASEAATSQFTMPACKLPNYNSSLPKCETGVSTHNPGNPADAAFQKREIRLKKNREAARVCRQKKKEYVSGLESRVAVLERQNLILIEELKNCRHKQVLGILPASVLLKMKSQGKGPVEQEETNGLPSEQQIEKELEALLQCLNNTQDSLEDHHDKFN